jgi:hypothetical protein
MKLEKINSKKDLMESTKSEMKLAMSTLNKLITKRD